MHAGGGQHEKDYLFVKLDAKNPADAAAIADWVSATGLRPFLDPLDAEERAGFLAAYERAIEDGYPTRSDGQRLLAFPRVFIVARKAV